VFVEFYDFAIFGFAVASAFPDLFFPKLPATQALVFSYLAYAVGHPARLLGAFIFGHFGDRSGRKFAFLINIVVVGASTWEGMAESRTRAPSPGRFRAAPSLTTRRTRESASGTRKRSDAS